MPISDAALGDLASSGQNDGSSVSDAGAAAGQAGAGGGVAGAGAAAGQAGSGGGGGAAGGGAAGAGQAGAGGGVAGAGAAAGQAGSGGGGGAAGGGAAGAGQAGTGGGGGVAGGGAAVGQAGAGGGVAGAGAAAGQAGTGGGVAGAVADIGRQEASALGSVLSGALAPFQQAAAASPEAPPGSPPPPSNPVRTVQQIAGGVMGLINLPVELMNTGFAVATNFISQALPSFPGAYLGSMYIGPPHIHMHPPNITPPNPVPVPLPSIGAVTLGTCVKVLISGMPAARAGDVGFAPTCGGFYPAFTVFLGSSKVFIGGMRAARLTDICRACQPDFGGPIRGVAAAMAVAGNAVALAGVVADAIDAGQATDPNVASAMGLSAAMNAAQMAADAVAMAITAAMGSDPAVPPIPGALITGATNVLIGGFPMINFPNPALMLFEKILKGLRGRKGNATESESQQGCKNCPK